MNWLNGVFALAGAVVVIVAEEFRRWRERRERFRDMTFMRRLRAHQEAFSWCQQIRIALNDAVPVQMGETVTQARAWWNDNCLFLDGNSRIEMIALMGWCREYASGAGTRRNVWYGLSRTLKAIVDGIGAEYLPEMSDNTDDSGNIERIDK